LIHRRRFDAQDGGCRPSKAIKSSPPLSETLGTTSTPFPQVISVAPETLALVNFPAVARGRPKLRRGAPGIRLGELGLPVEGIDLVWA
jgi:hypothetical protein